MIPSRPHRGISFAWSFLVGLPERVERFWEAGQRRRKAKRDSILLDAAVAIRSGRFAEADLLLTRHLRKFTGDCAYLNLLGAILESRGQHKLAGRAYSVANHVDRDYEPAKRNIRRLNECSECGRFNPRITLGDAQLRMQRTT